MASDLDDQWLYGDADTSNTLETSTPVKIKQEVVDETIKENGEKGETERPRTPTLDDSEVALNVPPQIAVNKIISMAPDLQPKQSTPEDMAAGTTAVDGKGVEEEEEEAEGEGGDSDSDDDDVEIEIGDITTTAANSYTRTPNYGGRVGTIAGGAGSIGKSVDVDVIPQVGGRSLLEFDLDEAASEKPWRLPGADIADYFNYGFTEDTWKLYCEKQRKMKGEVMQLNKIVVHSSARTGISDVKVLTPSITSVATIALPPPNILPPPGYPPPPIHPPPFLQPPPGLTLPPVPLEVKGESRYTPDPMSPKDGDSVGHNPSGTPPPADSASDGRATPGVDAPSSSNKPPLLPPPNIPPAPGLGSLPPPPFGMPPPPGFPPFPPSQDNLAAAMAAAMFGGGIRPPDGLPPPHMLNSLPPFPLPPQGFGGGSDSLPPPPFPGMPPNFPMDPGVLDDRNFSQDLLSGRLLGQFPWEGPPPQDFLDAFGRNNRPESLSRSRTSSASRSRSRSSSYDGRHRRKRERRHKRSRSRSYEREREREHRHRSGRHRNGDYHRSDRHDRDRDRERDRESRRRREHREEKSSRHERRRHRSSSRGRDEERTSRKEKSKNVEQELSRDSSKTP